MNKMNNLKSKKIVFVQHSLFYGWSFAHIIFIDERQTHDILSNMKYLICTTHT